MKSRNTFPQYIFKIPSWWTVRYFLYVRLALQICNVANWQILSYNVKKCIGGSAYVKEKNVYCEF